MDLSRFELFSESETCTEEEAEDSEVECVSELLPQKRRRLHGKQSVCYPVRRRGSDIKGEYIGASGAEYRRMRHFGLPICSLCSTGLC